MTGAELKKYRKHKKLTQKELGELYGFSIHAVRRWEQLGDKDIPKHIELLTMSESSANPNFSLEEWRNINLASALLGMTVDDFIKWAIDEKMAAIEKARAAQKKHITDRQELINKPIIPR